MSAIIPTGFKEALSKYPAPYDKEALLDDDKELWLIRIPDNLDEEDIANLKFKLPSAKSSKKALGKLEKKDDKYALYKVPTETEETDDMTEEENNDLGISGHEMMGFDCLVPSREDNGKLTFAPKKFDQYLILNQVVDIPDSTSLAQSIVDKPVYKREQPEGLKMRFLPYGYLSSQVTNKEETVEVKMEELDDKKRKRVSESDEEEKKKVKKEKKEKKEKKDKKKDKKEKK